MEEFEDRKLRIVQVIPALGSAFGGPAVGSRALNAALRRVDVDATVASAAYAAPSGAALTSGERDRILSGPVSVEIFDRSRPLRVQGSWGLLKYLWRRRQDTDFLHMHGLYLMPHVYAYLVSKVYGVPYGIQPHGSLEPYQRAQSRGRKWAYDKLIGRRVLRDASYFAFASSTELANARDVVGDRPAFNAPLGVNLDPPSPVETIDQMLDGRGREHCVLFLGRFARKKRPDALLRAWAEADRSEESILVMVGPDSDFTANELHKLAIELKIEKSVLIVGGLHAGEKAWIYERCGTYVLPSESENFGITVAEAMASGCYVIATRDVAASAHVEASGSGKVIGTDSSDELVSALSEVFAQPEILNLGDRGRSYAEEFLQWNVMASSLKSMWLEIGECGAERSQ